MGPVFFVAGAVVFWLLLSVKVLNEYERGVVFRLGKLLPEPKGPGLSTAWCGSPCARSCTTCRPRT